MPLISRNIDQIRAAVVGMGKMGRIHFNSLVQLASGAHEAYYKGAVKELLGKIRICSIADPAPQFSDVFDEIPCFKDFDELVAKTAPHIAIIASPTETHFELAEKSLQTGIHILVEKPIVTSDEQMSRLVELGQENECTIMAGHVERYNPVAIKIIEMLEQGTIQPREYSFVRTQKHDPRIPDDIITDKVIHDLDLAMYFFGPIENISLNQCKKIKEQVFQAEVHLEHERGIEGTIFVSWLIENEQKVRTVDIQSGKMKLLGDFVSKRLELDGKRIECEVPGMIKPANNQIKDELVDFIMSCCEPDPEYRPVKPLLTLPEIISSVKLIEQIRGESEKY